MMEVGNLIVQPKTLAELAFACYLYDCFTNHNDTLLDFQKATTPSPDLSNPEHTKALLTWLSTWGYHQFALEHHHSASKAILSWYDSYKHHLPNKDAYLWRMTESDFDLVGKAYASLSASIVSAKSLNSRELNVVGSTGATKILFAIRPGALISWDDTIRDGLGYDGTPASYIKYLKAMKTVLCSLGMICLKRGFELKGLPQKLGRPNATTALLLDEYNWVAFTKNCSLPGTELFRQWVSWSQVG